MLLCKWFVTFKWCSCELSVNFLKKIFLYPGHDRVVTIYSGIFFSAKVWYCLSFYVDLPGVVENTHPFAARVVDSRPSALLHPSGGHNCLTRCRLQMFLKPQVCVEYGNRTREYQSSYWLWTSVLNFSDPTRTGVTHSRPHPPLLTGGHVQMTQL